MQAAQNSLSPQQQKAVRFIARYLGENQRPPTMRELAAAVCGGAKTNPHYIVRPLRAKGYVALPEIRTSRLLTLTPRGQAWASGNKEDVTAPLPLTPVKPE